MFPTYRSVLTRALPARWFHHSFKLSWVASICTNWLFWFAIFCLFDSVGYMHLFLNHSPPHRCCSLAFALLHVYFQILYHYEQYLVKKYFIHPLLEAVESCSTCPSGPYNSLRFNRLQGFIIYRVTKLHGALNSRKIIYLHKNMYVYIESKLNFCKV